MTLHGTGTPRITIVTPTIHSNEVGSSTTTTVTLKNAASLNVLNDSHLLKGRMINTLSSSGVTYGVITDFNDTTDVITVKGWSNLNPQADAVLYIQGFIIDLPYCQTLLETWLPDFISHKMFSGNIELNKRGYYYTAILDYSQYLDGNVVELLKPLYRIQHKEIYFIPRSDNQNVQYKVDLSPELKFMLAQARAHSGHRNVRIELIGTRRLTEINFERKPAQPSGGYGTGYGYNYGSQL